MLPIHPYESVEILLGGLPKRTRTVLERRFGLSKNGRRATLETIGTHYGITRERVRQIERDGISRIKKSAAYRQVTPVFAVLEQYIRLQGGVVGEHTLLEHFDAEKTSANHVRFLLTLAPAVHMHAENTLFHSRWASDADALVSVEGALADTADSIRGIEHTLPYEEVLAVLKRNLDNRTGVVSDPAALGTYVSIAKCIGKNCFGRWGHVDSPLIRPRGVRDMAYLIFQKEGRPLHFLEAAERIAHYHAGKKVHPQTVHNELIKDNRFVLVGRGIYGLADWGYEPGTVRDIISRILKGGPLAKEDVVEQVLQKRTVKENTILINLQSKQWFKKLPDGRFAAVA